MEQSHWIVIGENLLERSHLFHNCLIVQELQHRKNMMLFSSKLCLRQIHMKEIYLKLNIEKTH